MDFETFLENFIDKYISLLRRKPYIPQFVIHELNRKPERIVEHMKNSDFDKKRLFSIIQQASDQGVIRPIHPVHLITNIIALCIFPFVAKPIITGFLLDGDQKAYAAYINQRPEEVTDFVKHAILLSRNKEV